MTTLSFALAFEAIKQMNESKQEKEEKIPKGCSKFYFYDDKILPFGYYNLADFSCIALNEKIAFQKYKKWKSLNTPSV